MTGTKCPYYRESIKGSKERQRPALGVRFTEKSVLRKCPLRESRLYICCEVQLPTYHAFQLINKPTILCRQEKRKHNTEKEIISLFLARGQLHFPVSPCCLSSAIISHNTAGYKQSREDYYHRAWPHVSRRVYTGDQIIIMTGFRRAHIRCSLRLPAVIIKLIAILF